VVDSIERLSFEMTTAALAEQERSLSGLRARTGTVLAAASVAGSFLGARTGHGSLDIWGIMALAAFALCAASAIWILLPHEVAFAFRGDRVFATSDRRAITDMAEAYRIAESWMETSVAENRPVIASLSYWLTVSCLLLAVEIVLWTVSIIG
jgi:hypothetical protein